MERKKKEGRKYKIMKEGKKVTKKERKKDKSFSINI